MKKKMNKFVLMMVSIVGIGLLTAANISNPIKVTGDWVAPKTADNIKNPLANDANATKAGKKIFNQMCAVCHGNKGRGDGIAGMALKPRPSNFTLGKVQSQTDGALFWKLTQGRVPMASYKKTLSETKRWQLVNYIRQFKK